MFGFKPITRETYSSNFLNTVVFQIQFNPIANIADKITIAAECFKTACPGIKITSHAGFKIEVKNREAPMISTESKEGIIEMKSPDGFKSILIQENSFTFSSLGQSYKSFDVMQNDLSNLVDFLTKIGVSKLTRLSIRKINIIGFDTSSAPVEMLPDLLSPGLLYDMDYLPGKTEIRKSMNNITYDKDLQALSIYYGLIASGENESIPNQAIIDIDRVDMNPCTTSDLWKKMEIINSEIFNVFSWATTENLKLELKKGRNE